MNIDRNRLIASFTTDTGLGANCPAQTVVSKGAISDELLVLEQENLDTRDSKDEDDMVVLDRDAQHALYLILKGRFE